MTLMSDKLPAVIARLRQFDQSKDIRTFLNSHVQIDVDPLIAELEGEGIRIDICDHKYSSIIEILARAGFVDFHAGRERDRLVLIPCREDFRLNFEPIVDDVLWQISRFVYMHYEGGRLIARHPLADCLLQVNDKITWAVIHSFTAAAPLKPSVAGGWSDAHADNICNMLARAHIIVPCTEDGKPRELCDAKYRQWDFHDLIFHSQSRLGRTEKRIGGTFSFVGDIPPLPAVKHNPWSERFYALPQPDVAAIEKSDMALTTAIEGRRSIRQHSVVPPSLLQLSEFLFRTVRTRSFAHTQGGELLSRPYPNGGGIYEQEFYVTIDACLDCPRGFYYYDSFRHGLCIISMPSADMESLLEEATAAAARLGRPQILITIASRFHRVGWKYRGMSYATQLKNIGAIYQTMYLVATSMNFAASALGIGNTDRFCRMAGVDYLEEGSIGEFMLGRPI